MHTKKKVRFIINPMSGANRSEDKPKIIKENIDHNKFDCEFQLSKYQGHATELSSEAARLGYDVVVACGGDGTVNEVAKGIAHTETALGIIPGGSGNGFAMYIGMGRNTKKAVQLLNTAEEKAIDTCYINDTFFLNLAGVGFDALIAYKAENQDKRGFSMYLSLVMKEMIKFKAEEYEILFDGKRIQGAYTTIAVANAPMYGYNFTIAPQAELTDGLFDIVLLKEASVMRTILASWRMLNRTVDKSSLVEVHKAKAVTIISKKPYYFHIDGESYKFEDKLTFRMDPSSLKVLFPKGQ